MAPLANTTVIPPGWQTHHRPVADKTMTLPCRILRPASGPPGWGEDEAPESVIWPPEGKNGFCRLQQLERDNNVLPADQPTWIRRMLGVVPVEVLPLARGGDGGDILEAGGRRYPILQVLPGSLIWECDLILQDNQTQNPAVEVP